MYDARAAWHAMPNRQQRRIVREAKRGHPPLPSESRAACEWATAVLTRTARMAPGRRYGIATTVLAVLTEAITGAAGVAVGPSSYDDPNYDFLPAVRRAARAVAKVCCEQ